MVKTKKPIIEVNNLEKTFIIDRGRKKVRALIGVDLTIYESDYMVIFGPSGCGKSTLLNLILGIDEPTEGEIFVNYGKNIEGLEVNGKNINKMSEDEKGIFRSKKIGMIYQLPYWIKSLNVLENIALPLIIEGVDESDALKRSQLVLEELDIAKLAKQLPAQLSGGEQQRAGVARALASDPPIIMADEPTGNLDSKNADKIMSLFDYLNKYYKKTIILVTHNRAYWNSGNRKVEMEDGRIIKDSYQNRITKNE